jgi:hypothetical protein
VNRIPTVEWQVAGACNYDCTYCIQSRKYRRGRPNIAQLENALAFFEGLPGEWEIKCSGGEAFAHPAFLKFIVPGLMTRTAHRISTLTNFSASHRDLMRFVHLTRGRLSVFSASLHLQFIAAEDFVAKAVWFTNQLDPEVRFVVNQVVLPGREEEALRCREQLEEEGVRWFPQLYKVAGGVAEYPNPAVLREVLGEHPGPSRANIAPSYKGRMCWAGVDYFAVDKTGEAWSCRTAKRHKQGLLGNIYDGSMTRLKAPSRCPWDICPCTVPANRGMIEGITSTADPERVAK